VRLVLIHALGARHLDVCQALLADRSLGCDINAVTHNPRGGTTPLELAARNNHIEVLRYLQGQRSNDSGQAFVLALAHGCEEVRSACEQTNERTNERH